MSQRQVTFVNLVGGVAADADSAPTLSDSAGTYGVKVVGMGDSGLTATINPIIAPAGTVMTKTATGTYVYVFTELNQGMAYDYSVRAVNSTVVTYAAGHLQPTYVDLPDVAAIAATLLSGQLTALAAASASDQAVALLEATIQVDRSMRFQGRKFDLVNQILEFPRVPYESDEAWRFLSPVAPLWPFSGQVWDWDQTAQNAIFPHRIRQAVLLQANFLLGGKGRELLDSQHAGVQMEQVGRVQRQLRADARLAETGLGREAYYLVRYYQLRTGRSV